MLKIRHYITFLCALSMNFSALCGSSFLPYITSRLLPDKLTTGSSSPWLTPDIKNIAGMSCAVALTAAVAWYGYKYYYTKPPAFLLSEADQREQDYQNGCRELAIALPDIQRLIKYRKILIPPYAQQKLKDDGQGALCLGSVDTVNIAQLGFIHGSSSDTLADYRRLLQHAQESSQTIAANMLQSALPKNGTTLIAVDPAQKHNNHKILYDSDKNTIFVSWMHLAPMFLHPNILIALLSHKQGHALDPQLPDAIAAQKNKDLTLKRTSEKRADTYAAQFTRHSCLGFISLVAYQITEYAMITGTLMPFAEFNETIAKKRDEIHVCPKDRLSLFVTHAKTTWELEKAACYRAIEEGIAHAEEYINLGALPRRTNIASYKPYLIQEFQNIIDQIYAQKPSLNHQRFPLVENSAE